MPMVGEGVEMAIDQLQEPISKCIVEAVIVYVMSNVLWYA